MPRPLKPRNCACPHRAGYSAVYKPAGTPLKDIEIIRLAQDELEALHLCDGEGMTQEEAGVCIGVSRGTVQRLLAAARCKVAQAIVGQKALAISSVEPEQFGYDDIIDELKTVVSRLHEDGEFPVWLLKDMQAIAESPNRYSGSPELVALLVRQAENYDPYAGAGCFDTSVSADAIAATLKKIVPCQDA
jgi:predicted DNA-binding protein (UPF0251 family)